MSFIKDVFGRNRRRNNGGTNNANSESGQDAQTGTTSSQPTQDLNRNRSGQVRTGAAAAVVDQHDAGSGQSGTQASQSQGTTQPQPQPRQGQGAAQSAQQGLATAQAQPVQAYPATQPTLGDTGLAQRLVAQALRGETLHHLVTVDSNGNVQNNIYDSELALGLAVRGYSRQLADQRARALSTGVFTDEVVIDAECVSLKAQHESGKPHPETPHLKIVWVWEDDDTGLQYASQSNIPASARSVTMRKVVLRKDTRQILGYL